MSTIEEIESEARELEKRRKALQKKLEKIRHKMGMEIAGYYHKEEQLRREALNYLKNNAAEISYPEDDVPCKLEIVIYTHHGSMRIDTASGFENWERQATLSDDIYEMHRCTVDYPKNVIGKLVLNPEEENWRKEVAEQMRKTQRSWTLVGV